MLDIGWSELLIVAVVAILVIGPRELPRALKTAGQLVTKVRGIAREFQSSVDDMIREADLEDLKKEAKSAVGMDSQDYDVPDRPAEKHEELEDLEHGWDVEGAKAPPHSILPPEHEAAEAERAGDTAEASDAEPPAKVTDSRANG